MGLLNGGLQRIFASVLSGIYLDATLHRPTRTDVNGTISETWADEPVKAQLDSATEAMRQSAGFTDTDQRIIVLALGVATITSDCEITVSGQRWTIAGVGRDPAGAYYDLHGQRA